MLRLLVSVCLLTACRAPEPAPKPLQLSPKVAATIEDEVVDSVVAVALTEQSTDFTAIANGRFNQRVKAGVPVKEGTVIAELNAPDVVRAAGEASAQARQAEAELTRAEAELTQAEQRLQARSGEGVVSRDERESAVSAVAIAKANLGVAKEKLAQAKERNEAARYRVAQLELVAPFDGAVSLWQRSDRSTVEPGAKLARFVGASTPMIRFALMAPRASKLSVGDAATFVQEKGAQPLVISRIASEADPHSGLVIVEGTLVPPVMAIRPGTPGRVQLRAPAKP
jgi:multidrug efflux pump subunit AcrA (membrane-fusion protein)